MRKISKLAALSGMDQEHVYRLCENRRYEDVVPILARPRSEGGLDLLTSRSALSRFVAQSRSDPERLSREVEKLLPLLEARSADFSRLSGAIRTLLEQHIFSLLASDQPFEKIERPFRILFKLNDREKNQLPPENNCNVPPLCGTIPPENARLPAFPANPGLKIP